MMLQVLMSSFTSGLVVAARFLDHPACSGSRIVVRAMGKDHRGSHRCAGIY